MTMMNLLGTGKDKVWKVRWSQTSDGWERQVKQHTWPNQAQAEHLNYPAQSGKTPELKPLLRPSSGRTLELACLIR